MLRFTIDFAVLIIAAVIGFITGAHKKKGFLKFLPFYCILVVCVELSGQYVQRFVRNNAPIYNIFLIIQLTYFLYFFRTSINGDKIKKIIYHLLWIFPLGCLVNILFIQGFYKFNTYSFTIACVLMITLGVIYFYRLFQNGEKIALFHEPAFWMSMGILFFFVCGLSTVSISNYLSNLPMSFLYNYGKILKLINAFFYLFFIIAFLCRSNPPKSSSRS
jgi:hypothetical protein